MLWNALNILLTRAYHTSANLREKFPHMWQMCEIDPTYVTNWQKITHMSQMEKYVTNLRFGVNLHNRNFTITLKDVTNVVNCKDPTYVTNWWNMSQIWLRKRRQKITHIYVTSEFGGGVIFKHMMSRMEAFQRFCAIPQNCNFEWFYKRIERNQTRNCPWAGGADSLCCVKLAKLYCPAAVLADSICFIRECNDASWFHANPSIR